MLASVLALIGLTFFVLLALYLVRTPSAIRRAGLDIGTIKRKDEFAVLPPRATWVSDNYLNLHEQPVVFYALAFYCQLAGTADATNVRLAWGYVALRCVHSFVQCTFNYLPLRTLAFTAGSLLLATIAIRCAFALL
ncbi:MAG TPA: MAPEG family protein [Polyangiales bacterium]|jgi:hypothetical protein|nr:MAPEG family protein [Polyangiales bacterium]